MKPAPAFFTALLLATLAALHAVAHQGAEATYPCEAAFGFLVPSGWAASSDATRKA
jgi:hypothetical protein